MATKKNQPKTDKQVKQPVIVEQPSETAAPAEEISVPVEAVIEGVIPTEKTVAPSETETAALEAPAPVIEEPKAEKTDEEKIMDFVTAKGNGSFVLINDFLRSLYGLPKIGAPAPYALQQESKKLKLMLSQMVANGQLQVKNNDHLKLGKNYYEGEEQFQKHYNINNLILEAKI